MSNRQEDEVTPTLLDVDALRAQFNASAPVAPAPAPEAEKPQETRSATKPSFRRGQAEAVTSESEEPAQRPKGEPRPNAYAGDCVRCGRRVEALHGHLGDRVDGKWTVVHAGECPPAPVATGDDEDAGAEGGDRPVPVDPRNPVPGIYTVEDAEGHVTLWVWQQQMDDDFAPGTLIVKFFFGRDNTDRDAYTSFAFIKEGRLQVWKKHRTDSGDEKRYVRAARVLLDDPSAVLQARYCYRCNALLTNPTSVESGYGPYCAKAWGI